MENETSIIVFVFIIILLGWGIKLIRKDNFELNKENLKLLEEISELRKSNNEMIKANFKLTKKNKIF
jgi:hypothetical protein